MTIATIAPAAPADSAADQIQDAIRELLDTLTPLSPEAVADELDQARKRDVAAYLGAINEGLGLLSSLAGAAVEQVEQFTGTTESIDQSVHLLDEATALLTEVADDLGPVA
jgi:hypothetical protein